MTELPVDCYLSNGKPLNTSFMAGVPPIIPGFNFFACHNLGPPQGPDPHGWPHHHEWVQVSAHQLFHNPNLPLENVAPKEGCKLLSDNLDQDFNKHNNEKNEENEDNEHSHT
ncbi:hypothetical protein PCANC_13462 [Puccinia coronata f. sp. avenae]|uniref:Uncharacterized protein n=1 Tax=Puccinia coronata f. sp. avenae TaxID=200324 RepID=A0A2N5SR98_9BASI|nr:hypothetical protein PCANC_13462 [Puccinia coronata f. sp. avenae]